MEPELCAGRQTCSWAGELVRARVTAQGFQEIGRTVLIKRTSSDGKGRVAYAAPAYANRHVFARNDDRDHVAKLADHELGVGELGLERFERGVRNGSGHLTRLL